MATHEPGDAHTDLERFCAEVQALVDEDERFRGAVGVRPGAPRLEGSVPPATVDLLGVERSRFFELMGYLAANAPDKPALDYPPVRRLLAPKRRKPPKRRR